MFTRDIYQDYSAYERSGKYSLMPQSTHRGPDTCFQEIPEMHPNNRQYKISLPTDMVNIESDLYNLIRPNSKDPLQKYPFIMKNYDNPPGPLPVCSGPNDFNLHYPKLEGSQFNREKSIHVPRFESLCLNPQQSNRIRSNNVIGLNTRLYNRDSHQPNIPTLTDHSTNYIEQFSNTKKAKKYKKKPKKMKQKSTKKYYQKQQLAAMKNKKEPFCGTCAAAMMVI